MCPLWPFHYLLTYILVLVPLWILCFQAVGSAADSSTKKWDLRFEPSSQDPIFDGETVKVKVRSDSIPYWLALSGGNDMELKAQDENLVQVFPKQVSWMDSMDGNNSTAEETPLETPPSSSQGREFDFSVTGRFLGKTKVCLVPKNFSSPSQEFYEAEQAGLNCFKVTVIRKSSRWDTAFTASVVMLVMIMFVSMGAALDLQVIKETLRRPYGPVIGLLSQFCIMPLLSFGLAKAFIEDPSLQLGLFITGCSPGGGASNLWTLTLGGNLDLSVTMTTISTLCAFVMMPAWILTLGATIFEEAELKVPYSKMATLAVSLIVPLMLGLMIQKYLPKASQVIIRWLKPFTFFLIVYIVVFAAYVNYYVFRLFTWEIMVSGMLLPWLGYLFGGGMALLLARKWEDVIAIGIETGVQNTGLAIFALRVSLPQPEADITTVLPVAVAVMTPVIPTLLFLMQKIRNKNLGGFTLAQKEDSTMPVI